MSLKSQLLQAIKQAYPDYSSYDRLEKLCKDNGRKVDNFTRRMRELCDGDHPLVVPIKNEKKMIIGYKYLPENDISFIPEPIIQTQEQLFKPMRVRRMET